MLPMYNLKIPKNYQCGDSTANPMMKYSSTKLTCSLEPTSITGSYIHISEHTQALVIHAKMAASFIIISRIRTTLLNTNLIFSSGNQTVGPPRNQSYPPASKILATSQLLLPLSLNAQQLKGCFTAVGNFIFQCHWSTNSAKQVSDVTSKPAISICTWRTVWQDNFSKWVPGLDLRGQNDQIALLPSSISTTVEMLCVIWPCF